MILKVCGILSFIGEQPIIHNLFMRITLLAGGILKTGPLRSMIQEYEKRLTWNLVTKEIPEGPTKKTTEAFLEKIPPQSFVIALDEVGKNYTSPEFATLIQEKQNAGFSNFCFLIGTADGLDSALDPLIHQKIAFGKATWPHLLARFLLMEQLYRAQQIISGHPYHRV